MNTIASASSAGTLLREGIKQIRAGNLPAAQAALEQSLTIDPQNIDAWLWLSGAVTDPADQQYCLEQVLHINPEHAAARRGLTLLAQKYPHLAQAKSEPEHVAVSAAEPAYTPFSLPDPEPEPESSQPSYLVGIPQSTESSVSAPVTRSENEAAVQAAIKALGRSATADEVCRMLSLQYNYSWGDAQRLVARLQTQYAGTIARKQSPYMLMLSAVALLGGIGLLGYLLIVILSAGPNHELSLGIYIMRRIHLILLGFGLFAGGIYGIIETSASLFKKDTKL